jgi:hypothetical protein
MDLLRLNSVGFFLSFAFFLIAQFHSFLVSDHDHVSFTPKTPLNRGEKRRNKLKSPEKPKKPKRVNLLKLDIKFPFPFEYPIEALVDDVKDALSKSECRPRRKHRIEIVSKL